METQVIHYKESRISYHRFGSGLRLIVCFHGYGEDASSFAFLEKTAGSDISFFAIELPFHGSTDWKEGLNFSHHELIEIVELILADNNYSGKNFDLMGFSLGGRMALSMYQLIPGRIGKLILLAPDGLKMNFWYWLATQTWTGNRFFKFTMKYPGWFFGFLKLMNKLGLMNASIFKFVNYYIGDKEVRRILYERWTCLRKLRPNLHRIKYCIRKYKNPVRLIYGKHDRIILSSVGEKFRKGIEEYCTITLINSGHQVLHEKHAAEIISCIV